ncbi:MAG: HD domain-containing protein [Parcubacteria group bacterium]|jgi:hypothetical protein
MTIIEKAKNRFNEKISVFRLADHLKEHLKEFEKIAEVMLLKFPEADRETVLLAMWLHDAECMAYDNGEDHAVIGEAAAREWLVAEGYDKGKAEKVLHCVRAHRCKDVMPETLEAKIIAYSDSASHLTQGIYLNIARREKEGDPYDPLAKLERDWRDLALFPEMREELMELYQAWRELIIAYRKTNI